MNELPITYRDFWDFPRMFVVERHGELFLFSAAFLPERDDFASDFSVFRLRNEARPRVSRPSWEGLAEHGELVGVVSIGNVQFDPSKRLWVSDRIFDHLS